MKSANKQINKQTSNEKGQVSKWMSEEQIPALDMDLGANKSSTDFLSVSC